MAGKTPYEAVVNYLQPLRRAVSCVTNAGALQVDGYYPKAEPNLLVLGKGPPERLADGRELTVEQRFRIIATDDPDRGPWKVKISGYTYALDDSAGQEIVAYHWHPHVEPTRPHIHVGAGSVAGSSPLVNAHLPSNRVALEDFLRLLLTDLSVPATRPDWDSILVRTQDAFERWRTW